VDAEHIRQRVAALADEFDRDRRARQLRRELVAEDFDRLREAGFLLTGVPLEMGGIWDGAARSTRPICEILRTLARGDSSVALVSAMHPAVLSFWLSSPTAPEPYRDAWAAQRRSASEAALNGGWWGTITSEPGSGGDITQSRAVARHADGAGYVLSGQKHFGSGSGIASYMLTTAVPEGESEPDWFYLETRGVPWDGSAGRKLVAPWDGHGMTATQSHAFDFTDFPATRFTWEGALRPIQEATGGFIACCFTAVIVGIVDIALETARRQLEGKRAGFRPYEQVEWSQANVECWLIVQAYEGMLRAMETQGAAPREALYAKTAIADLAERALGRMCRVAGGGVYARQSPLGFWFEDVRALGFLRPPWSLAYDRLFEDSW
jgi:alkylation response protein AidB-like acyl-CoA dehydrogenase